MLDIKFLDKVVDQIISETMINNDKLYAPFSLIRLSPVPSRFSRLHFRPFSFHCKEVYSLKNDQEIEYVWTKYKKEIVDTINNKKELNHKDKRMMIHNSRS